MAVVKSRRQEYAESTYLALTSAAQRLFVERGYAATSIGDVVNDARVSAGALYHHFAGKKELFRVVHDGVQRSALGAVEKQILTGEPTWEWVCNGLHLYLVCCLEPTYRTIVLQEGPIAMGWEEWRRADQRHSLPLLDTMLTQLMDAGVMQPQPVALTARLLCAAIGEAALTIAAGDADITTAETTLNQLVLGLRRAKADD